MTEPSRQHRQPGLDITAVAVEVQQCGDGEAVAQIVHSWAASTGRRDPGIIEEAREGASEVVHVDSGAASADEEAPPIEIGEPQVAAAAVVPQGGDRGVVQEQSPNFESRIKSVAASRSTWSSSSRHASDLRIPVTASSPISVCQVAARSGGVNRAAASMSAAISPGEYRYGVIRHLWCGNASSGGISLSGSRVW